MAEEEPGVKRGHRMICGGKRLQREEFVIDPPRELSCWWAGELGSRSAQGRVEREGQPREGEGVGKVEALLASSMLGLMKEGIPAEFLVWDPAGCLVLCLRPFLLEGKGGHVEAQCVVDCFISWKGEWVEGGQEPQPEQTAVHPTV